MPDGYHYSLGGLHRDESFQEGEDSILREFLAEARRIRDQYGTKFG